LKGTATLLPPVEIAWMVSRKVAGAARVGRLITCEVGLAVSVPVCTTTLVVLVEAVMAGVMPPVVVTVTVGVQVPFANPAPEVGVTVKVSVCAVLLSVTVEVAGAMEQFAVASLATEAVTEAGSVVGLAGDTDSAAVVVQVTLAVPAVSGLPGVQVRAGRLITGGAAMATVTVAEVVVAEEAPLAVMVAVAGPTVVGRLAGTMVIVSVCRPAVVEVGLSVIHGQGVTAGEPQLELKFTVPLVPNCCSCVVNTLCAGAAWPRVKAVVNGPGGTN